MNRHKRKIFSILLSISILCSLLQITLYAETNDVDKEPNGPAITITGGVQNPNGSLSYCLSDATSLTVTVTDDEGLASVETLVGTTSGSPTIDGNQAVFPIGVGSWTIKAKNTRGVETDMSVTVFNHILGGRRMDRLAPTCTEAGWENAVAFCAFCGKDIPSLSTKKTLAPLGHTYVEQTIHGTIQKVCKNCGELEEGSEAIEHTWVTKTEGDGSACEGSYTYEECEVCHAIQNIEDKRGPGHAVNKWEITEGATCAKAGVETGVCVRCGKTQTRSFQYTGGGHQYMYFNIVEPTCTETGLKARICTVEGCPQETVTYINGVQYDPTYGLVTVKALGHSYSYGQVRIVNATCTEDGYIETLCDRCQEPNTLKREVIKAFGHTPAADDGDCTTPIKCTVCGEIAVAGKENHNYKTKSTGTSYGDGHYEECQNSGCNNKTEVKQHVNPATNASCTSSFICSVCNVTVKGSARHDFSGKPVRANNLFHTYTCQNPGCTVTEQGIHYWISDPNDCTKASTCVDCGFTQAAHGSHNWGKWVNTGDQHERYCQNDGCTGKQEAVHDFTGEGTWIVTQEATCTQTGLQYQVIPCADGCGATWQGEPVEIPAKGHQYGDPETVTDSHCGVYKKSVCRICGDILLENEGKVEHTWSTDLKVIQPATCTAEGSESYYCTVCGEMGYESSSIPALGHQISKYTYNNDATCTEDGTEIGYCEREGCNETETRVKAGSALGHDFQSYQKNGDATCLEDGTKSAKCERCDAVDTMEDEGSALGHNFVYEITEATCTKDGEEVGTCTRTGCDATETHTIEALGHSFTNYVYAGDATCFADGTLVAVCDRCNETNTKAAPETKREHNLVIIQVSQEASCEEDAIVLMECSYDDCEYEEEKQLEGSALGHDYSSWILISEATCTEGDVYESVCSRCGNIGTVTEGEPLGHDYEGGIEAEYIGPTCTQRGYTIDYCNRCGAIRRTVDETEKGDLIDHDFGEWIVVKDPTCTEDGEESRFCNVCKTVETRTIEALGHTFKDGVCVVCGVKETGGEAKPEVQPGTDSPATTPATGDKNHAGLWLALLLLSMIVVTTLTIKKKHQHQ